MKLVHSNVHVQVFTFTGGPPPNWLERYSWYAPVQVSPADTMPVRDHSHEHVSFYAIEFGYIHGFLRFCACMAVV